MFMFYLLHTSLQRVLELYVWHFAACLRGTSMHAPHVRPEVRGSTEVI